MMKYWIFVYLYQRIDPIRMDFDERSDRDAAFLGITSKMHDDKVWSSTTHALDTSGIQYMVKDTGYSR